MNGGAMQKVLAIAALTFITACGGGNGTTPPGPSSGGNHDVAMTIAIPVRPANLRNAQFVSPATQGALIQVTGATTLTATFNLTAGSNLCTTTGTQRTCTVDVTVNQGVNVFSITTYDQPPSNGAFPAGAHILGQTSLTVNVGASQESTGIDVFLGGQIGSIGVSVPAFESIPADAASHTIAYVITPKDFDNQPITAGANDPFSNPITVSIAESGGSGHATLLLNGSPSGTSATVLHSSDTVSIVYDGGGAPGYFFTISASAKGAATQTAQVSPMYVALASAVLTSALSINGTGTSRVLAITEAGAPGSTTYTATPTNCTNIVTLLPVTGGGAAAQLTVNGAGTPSATGCTVSIKDSTNTALTLGVTNTPVNGGIPIGGTTITEYNAAGGPYGISTGPDGRIWIVETTAGAVGVIKTDGTGFQSFVVCGCTAAMFDITSGPDGALWLGNQVASEGLARITTSGAISEYPTTGSLGCAQGLTTISDGTLYVSNNCGSPATSTASGNIATLTGWTGGILSTSVAQGADGAVWFADGTNIERYDPVAHTMTSGAVPFGATAQYIAAGPDNAMWFTASGGTQTYIGRVPLSGSTVTPAVVTPLSPTATPLGITAGVDNAMWYVDASDNVVGRVSTTAGNTASTYGTGITARAGLQEITRGPDGTLWFTETSANKIGHVIP
jgi:virginiamycin B lyase